MEQVRPCVLFVRMCWEKKSMESQACSKKKVYQAGFFLLMMSKAFEKGLPVQRTAFLSHLRSCIFPPKSVRSLAECILNTISNSRHEC